MTAADDMPGIVIVGGGLAGLVTALVLARHGHAVRLMDNRPAINIGGGASEKIRTTTLNPFSYGWLKKLGIVDALATAPAPIHHIEVSDSRSRPRPGFAVEDRLLGWDSDESSTPLAYTARNDDLVAAAYALAAAHDAITLMPQTRITEWHPKHPQAGHAAGLLVDAHGDATPCALVIACDGGASPMRSLAGIRTVSRNPGQTAIVADIHLSRPHQQRAWQRFLEDGPLALMPLADPQLASLVWTMSDDNAGRLLEIADDRFDAALNDEAVSPFGDLAVASSRHAWPLRLNHAIKPCATRLVLVGDAAHAIHPLAGQGFNLAMGDAAALATAIDWGRDRGLDPGASVVLNRYARARLAEVATITAATDGLNLLFGKAPPQLRAVTAMAMAILDRSPLKKMAMTIASGGFNRRG